jgi:hypothetical protein
MITIPGKIYYEYDQKDDVMRIHWPSPIYADGSSYEHTMIIKDWAENKKVLRELMFEGRGVTNV